MKEKYITGILGKHIGMRDIAIADLATYLDHAVGVGEHGDIGHEIERKIKEISDCDDMVNTINKYFATSKESESTSDDK